MEPESARGQNWLVAYRYKGHKVDTYKKQLWEEKALKTSSARV
jgi:hypothetical protein